VAVGLWALAARTSPWAQASRSRSCRFSSRRRRSEASEAGCRAGTGVVWSNRPLASQARLDDLEDHGVTAR